MLLRRGGGGPLAGLLTVHGAKRGGGAEMVLGFSLESAYGLFNDPTGLVLEPRAAEVLHFTGSNHWWGVWNTGVTAASGPPPTLTHTENGF